MNTHCHFFGTATAVAIMLAGCGPNNSEATAPGKNTRGKPVQTMKLATSAFTEGSVIPAKYTADGKDVSPPLAWSNVPKGTRSFALICDDPDAPSPKNPAKEPWVHWILFNLDSGATALPARIGHGTEPKELRGACQGANSWPHNNIGYRGPAPPPGSGQHRYVFKLYALNATLELDPGATKKQLLAAMAGHVLAEGQLIGVYER